MANQDIAMNLKVKPIQGSRAMKLKLMMGVLVLCFGARSFADTLCTSNEQAIFSCTLASRKTASLCAPKDLKAPGLYLQYRFGTHQKIELTYPEEKEFHYKFRWGFAATSPQSGGYYVDFSIGQYDYFMLAIDYNDLDIAIYKQNKLLRNLHCGNSLNDFSEIIDSGNYKNFYMPKENDLSGVPGLVKVLKQGADDYMNPVQDPYKSFYAAGLAVDALGNIFASGRGRISELKNDGKIEMYAGKASVYMEYSEPHYGGFRDGDGKDALFDGTSPIVVDAQDNIYVLDYGNALIRKIGLDGNVSTFTGIRRWAGSEDGPRGVATIDTGSLAIDDSGTLYIFGKNNGHNVIRKIDKNGTVSTVVNKIVLGGVDDLIGSKKKNGIMINDGSFAVDHEGNFYVAGTANEKAPYLSSAVIKITPYGMASVVAGNLNESGFIDGYIDQARFNGIDSICFDRLGNIFISDWKNNSVRKITSNREVITVVNFNKNINNQQGFIFHAKIKKVNPLFQGALTGLEPTTLALDAEDNLYLTAYGEKIGSFLFKVTPSGQVITLWSVTGPNKVVYFRHGQE